MSHFKTEKGTELPLLDLRGKPYLQVAHRLVWFREQHPNWSIETTVIEMSADHTITRAVIKDETGKIMATAHKQENTKGFVDHLEKSETGSVGRALAMCGFGTQFAPDLDEEERIVDAPINRARPLPPRPQPPIDAGIFEEEDTRAVNDPNDPGTFVFNLPKFKGKRLKDIPRKDLVSYLNYMNSPKAGPLSNDGKKLLEAASKFLGDRTEI